MSRLCTKPFSPLCSLAFRPTSYRLLSVTRCWSALGLEAGGRQDRSDRRRKGMENEVEWPQQTQRDQPPYGGVTLPASLRVPAPAAVPAQQPPCWKRVIYGSGLLESQVMAGSVSVYTPFCTRAVRATHWTAGSKLWDPHLSSLR